MNNSIKSHLVQEYRKGQVVTLQIGNDLVKIDVLVATNYKKSFYNKNGLYSQE